MKRTIAVLAGLLFIAGTGLALADTPATASAPTTLIKNHHKGQKNGGKGVSSHLRNTKHPEYKDGEDGVNRKHAEYKDGEDGVMRTKHRNHKKGKAGDTSISLYKDGEDGVMRTRPGNHKPGDKGDNNKNPELNPQPLPPGIKPPPGQGGANLK